MASEERQPLLDPKQNRGSVGQTSYTDERGAHSADQSQESGNGADPGTAPMQKVRMLSILLPVSIGTFLAAMDATIVASSYASIGNDLKQLQSTSWIATGYMLTLTSIQPLYGKLSDIFGRKACLLFAHFIFGLGCLFCGLARSMEELIAARIFAGIGGGGMTTVVSILVSDIVPLRQRGTWQGILNIVFSVGSASGAPLGGFLADNVGWRWAFLVQVPITLIAFLAVFFALHPPVQQRLEMSTWVKFRRIDILGAIALVTAVFSLLFGLDRGSNISWLSSISYGSLIASLVTPSLAKEPFAPKHIIVNASLIGSYLTNFFAFGASLSAIFHVSLYAQAVQGKSASETGALLIPAIFAGVTGSLLAGFIMQKTGKYKWLTSGSLISMIAGTNIQTFFTCVDQFISGLVLIRLGGGSSVTTTLIALIANVTAADQAVAIAVSYLFRSLGGVVGISLGSALVQNTLRVYLADKLTGRGLDVEEIVRHVRESLSYIDTLDPATRVIVRSSYEKAVASAFWLTTLVY
ncbi:hypothetical protein M422DRAFT_62375 [Sphaerobolus stellatus SS14]|uniref:Major facilitator superfamily (MFS) profile domain-containing protein n=1 Tax=Sphaerobolus stellatus (strain SS14) TaxID=990650 RepID=A0A0C9UEV3_SPHS4|nr:hypothetical protein M422DRAFT_62375 [Sphaerobolus stellatus SS14]